MAGLGPSLRHPQCAAGAGAGLGGVEQGASCRDLNLGAPDQGRSGFGPERASGEELVGCGLGPATGG